MTKWKNDNLLMQESLPVEDRSAYRSWKKAFEDNETSRVNFRKNLLAQATAPKIEDFLLEELKVIETVASNTSSGGDINYDGVTDLVRYFAEGYIPSSSYMELGEMSYICELWGPECLVKFVFIPERMNSNYSKYTIKENFKYFKENSPIYIIVDLGTLTVGKIEGDPRRFFSRKGYSLMASALNKGLISVPENGKELLAKLKNNPWANPKDNFYIFTTNFATITDEASLTKIAKAVQEIWCHLYDEWERKNNI